MSWHLEVQGDPFATSKMRNLRLEKQLQPTNCWMTLDEKMLAFAFLLTFPVERILKCHMYLSLENSCYGSKIEDAGDHRFTIQVWGTIPEGQELDLEDEECGTSEVFFFSLGWQGWHLKVTNDSQSQCKCGPVELRFFSLA